MKILTIKFLIWLLTDYWPEERSLQHGVSVVIVGERDPLVNGLWAQAIVMERKDRLRMYVKLLKVVAEWKLSL